MESLFFKNKKSRKHSLPKLEDRDTHAGIVSNAHRKWSRPSCLTAKKNGTPVKYVPKVGCTLNPGKDHAVPLCDECPSCGWRRQSVTKDIAQDILDNGDSLFVEREWRAVPEGEEGEVEGEEVEFRKQRRTCIKKKDKSCASKPGRPRVKKCSRGQRKPHYKNNKHSCKKKTGPKSK